MQSYKADKFGNIINQDGEIVLTILSGKCSYKFKRMACKELANVLSNIERGRLKRREYDTTPMVKYSIKKSKI